MLQYTKTEVWRFYYEQSYRGTQKKYIENPSEGLTAEDIKKMSDDDLLNMDFFLHEDDGLEDDIEEDGFFIF